jgi:hypothetical protein
VHEFDFRQQAQRFGDLRVCLPEPPDLDVHCPRQEPTGLVIRTAFGAHTTQKTESLRDQKICRLELDLASLESRARERFGSPESTGHERKLGQVQHRLGRLEVITPKKLLAQSQGACQEPQTCSVVARQLMMRTHSVQNAGCLWCVGLPTRYELDRIARLRNETEESAQMERLTAR